MLYERRNNRGRFIYFEDGVCHTAYVPVGWTDLGPIDPFVEESKCTAYLRFADIELFAQAITRMGADLGKGDGL